MLMIGLRLIPLVTKDECFDPKGDIDEIDAFLDANVSIDIEDGYHDSEGDIIYLESFLINDTIPNLPPKVFLNHHLKSLKDELDNDDLKSMVKIFDPDIHVKIISPTYVRLTFEDRHYFSLTFVIRIFLPYLTYSMDSLLLLSFGSEDTIFNPGIFAYSFYSLETGVLRMLMIGLRLIPLVTKDECFDPKGDIDEIDAFLDANVSIDIEDGYHDSEGDIIYLESFLINDTIPNLPPK
nr:hypothetical protein [Tanacetum cinerariifolium]